MLLKKEEGDYFFVHGSPRDPRYEYILPTDVAYGLKDKLEEIFSMFSGICFVGHSHLPGIFTEDLGFIKPEDTDDGYEHEKGKIVVNVGSVGQPRDSDRRSCYVVVDDGHITFCRPRYDFNTTFDKIRRADGLDDYLGERLTKGR